DFKKAIEIDPRLALAYSGLGFVYERLAMYEEALKNFNTFVEIASDDYEEFVEQARAKIKDLEAALKK
ncbi:MAG: hypothetical protein KJ727_01465, partial [Acidobacteria bacterium]|nr:hypothetical protein [Acidobacteriota bacterium]